MEIPSYNPLEKYKISLVGLINTGTWVLSDDLITKAKELLRKILDNEKEGRKIHEEQNKETFGIYPTKTGGVNSADIINLEDYLQWQQWPSSACG